MIDTLSKFPAHSPVFIDANIFLYFLLKDEKYFSSCQEFLTRIETGEVVSFSDIIAINETIFLYVKTHLIARHNLIPGQFLAFAKTHPDKIAEVDIKPCLNLFAIETLRIIEPPKHILVEYLPQLHRYGLLPNDAYHLLTMDYLNLNQIATNDKDFEQIPYLTIWKP